MGNFEDGETCPSVHKSAGKSDDEDESLPVGSRAGDYIIVSAIAKGGCGSVHEAEHCRLGRRAALKVMHSRFVDSAEMTERFIQEAKVVNLIRHPNIVDIYELGALPDGRPYFVMELLKGLTLRESLKQTGRLSAKEALELLRPVCDALSAAHQAGVIHRDIKASNILILPGPPQKVKLLDFGIAKLLNPEPGKGGLTTATRRLGSPACMAPEQIKGLAIDARTDVYALGVLLYLLVTGQLPFDATDSNEMERKHLESPAPRASAISAVSPAIDEVILRCLEKRPAQRYDSVRGFLGALTDAISQPVSRQTVLSEAIGIFVGMKITDDGEINDMTFAEIASVLDSAEQILRQSGHQIVMQTSNEILGAKIAPKKADATSSLKTAEALFVELQPTISAPGVHLSIVVHVDAVSCKEDGVEIADGALLQTEQWVPDTARAMFQLTPAATRHLG